MSETAPSEAVPACVARDVCRLYIGTRSTEEGAGISASDFDAASAVAGPVSVAAQVLLPTTFALSVEGKHLYTTSEIGNDGSADGYLHAYAIQAGSARLIPLNTVSSNGGGPTHLALDRTGRHLVVANFGAGRTNVFAIAPDGSLGAQTAAMQHAGHGPLPRQKGPRAHGVALSPDNRFVLSADMGADRVFVYRFDAGDGSLSAHDVPFFQGPPGSGPRQVVFHPHGDVVYLLNELNATVAALRWSRDSGTLQAVQTISALEPGAAGEPSAAGIAIHPKGTHLYTTTRSDDSIQVYGIDPQTAHLRLVQRTSSGGLLPWACTIHPSGTYLSVSNLSSDAVSVFALSPADGTIVSEVARLEVPAPVASIFAPVSPESD